jgi:large subunit ribosomal protein L29
VKAEELRELDPEELSGRLKGARRELFELRFKLAVGQLDNPRQIRKVRGEIARILTVVHERRLDEEVQQVYAGAEAIMPPAPEAPPEADSETPEEVEAEETPAEEDVPAGEIAAEEPESAAATADEAEDGGPAAKKDEDT